MNNSPYLDRPLLPLAVALPRMLEQIEAELADGKVSAAEKRRRRQRAELVRGLITGAYHLPRRDLARAGRRAAFRSSGGKERFCRPVSQSPLANSLRLPRPREGFLRSAELPYEPSVQNKLTAV
jgi:hypothetical protein